MGEETPVVNRVVVTALIVGAVIAAGYAMQHTVSCFLLSFVIAYLLDPVVVLLERRKVRRVWGIICLYLLLTLFSIFFFVIFVPFISLRWEAFITGLPVYLQKGKAIVLTWKSQLVPRYAMEEWRWLFDTAGGQMDKLLATLGSSVYEAAAGFVFNLFNLVLAPILVFFMLYYKESIKEGIIRWLPHSRRDALIALGREINSSIGGYIRGQLVVSAIVALFATLALILLGIDYPIFNGIFAGLASVLPFIGVILATLPPLFFAYVQYQSGVVLLKVLGAFAVIYFLEGYLVKPLVFKESMNLNPLVTIIVVMAFGELMGFWGILLAIPIAAAARIVSDYIRRGELHRH
ncbi:AI-2E family transporter [Geotalea uraniireducens]|uniref:AI-2E family transporter n=1 Tax=Geotalea uraniireducens TaxID=351604 RepID=A0ABM8EN69_9BACT|nr:AI-2E family transporter [Geotalea uraniireducens]BDV43851.1 AI-2E family transporter [Geotalea uraniireducens]